VWVWEGGGGGCRVRGGGAWFGVGWTGADKEMEAAQRAESGKRRWTGGGAGTFASAEASPLGTVFDGPCERRCRRGTASCALHPTCFPAAASPSFSLFSVVVTSLDTMAAGSGGSSTAVHDFAVSVRGPRC
jgi:hypothetical protein